MGIRSKSHDFSVAGSETFSLGLMMGFGVEVCSEHDLEVSIL